MVVTSKHRTHKVMEAAIRELMGAGTPPRFKFQDTYASIEFPSGYTIPAQATLEAKYDELLALEEDIQKTIMEGDLEVGTSNLFVDTETGNVGIGTTNPAYTLDVHGTSNVGALTATSVSGSGSGLTSLNASNLASGTVPSARLSLAASDIPNLSATKITSGTLTRPISTTTGTFSGDVGIGTTSPIARLDINGGAENNTTPALSIRGGLYDPSDLYVLNTYNVNTGVGYAAKVIGVNIKNKVETDNTVQIRNNVGGVTSAGAIYLGSDDLNQGIFGVLGGTGTVGSTLAEYLTVKGNGNVGIGTASPSSSLHVNLGNASGEQHIRATQTSLASSTAGIRFGDSTWDAFIDHSHGSKDLMNFGFYRNPTRQVNMVLSHEGNVGIGTTSPNRQLEIYGNSSNYFSFSPTEADDTSVDDKTNFGATSMRKQMMMRLNNRTWYWGIINNASNNLGLGVDGGGGDDPDIQCVFQNNGTFWTKNIRTSGNVGIGTTSPGYKLDVNGTIYASGDVIMFSDERKKTHIEAIPNALEKVLQLRGVTFNKLDDDNRRHSGVIAQEVEKVLPEVVYTAEDDTKSVAYGNMIGLLIEAIKELAEK